MNTLENTGEEPIYLYDEFRCRGIPTPAVAQRILSDLKTGRAIPYPIIEPGYKQRLIDIINGRPIDPRFFGVVSITTNPIESNGIV